MSTAKRPRCLLHKRGREGAYAQASLSDINANGNSVQNSSESQDRHARDGLDETTRGPTSSESYGLRGLQGANARKNRQHLTASEYALQQIRTRVQAIDERWEEANVRATNTLDNIKENDELDRQDLGRKGKWPGDTTARQRDAVRKFSLLGKSAEGVNGINLSRGPADLLEESKAVAWLSKLGGIGRAVTRDERLAVSLAQSHENLAAAAVKFEETQERNDQLLGGLRGWMDGFTGTARPEDTNPIIAMLPEPELEDEVFTLMTQCKDAASMLEQTTKRHTAQLGEIFSQAGKIYGAEIERVHSKGMKTAGAAQWKVANLQKHANKVETLLRSMQSEREILQTRFAGVEQRCRTVEACHRKDKNVLEEALKNYRHRVIQLQHVVAGYEKKCRKQEQLERDPRLGRVIERLSTPLPSAESDQPPQVLAETATVSSRNQALTKVGLHLADQGAKQTTSQKKSAMPVEDPQVGSNNGADEATSTAKEHDEQTQRALVDAKRENQKLATDLKTTLKDLEREKQRPTVVNESIADNVEQGLREALRKLRVETSRKLKEEAEARSRAVYELKVVLDEARGKEKATTVANVEIARLQTELENTQGKLQALLQSAEVRETSIRSESPQTTQAPTPSPGELHVKAEMLRQALSSIDYGKLIERVIDQGGEELTELRRKARDAGVAERHFDAAQSIFSGVVDCCGEGLASIEQISQESTAIIDLDASKTQEALAVALEKSITPASLLLKESLVGQIRACEAEKQASLERETADQEHSKATLLAQEKNDLCNELQHQLAEASTLKSELAILRSENEILEERLESPMDEGATWRRRYEHLAGLVADMTKESSTKIEKSALAAHGDGPLKAFLPSPDVPLGADSGKSETTPEAHKMSVSDSKEISTSNVATPTTDYGSITAKKAGPKTGTSEDDPSAGVTGARERNLTSQSGIQDDGVKGARISACWTQVDDFCTTRRDNTADIAAAVRDEAQTTKDRTLPSKVDNEVRMNQEELLVAAPIDTGERGGLRRKNAPESQPQAPLASTEKKNRVKNDPDGKSPRVSLKDDSVGESDDRANGNKSDPDAPRECQVVRGSGREPNTDPKGFDEAVTIVGGAGNQDREEEHRKMTNNRNRGNNMSCGRKRLEISTLRNTDKMTTYSAEGGDSKDGHPDKEALASAFSGMTTPKDMSGKVLKESGSSNRDSDEDSASRDSGADSIDEDQVLDKLLDERTPSIIFREDHHKLLQKLLKSQDENKVAMSDTGSPSPSCQECPVLRLELAERCAEIAKANEEHLMALEELGASQHRVYVMTSEMASLHRKIAEHAEVIRRARSFADKVVSAPGTDPCETREALDLKEFSDNAINGRGSGSGSRVPRSPKRKAAAAAAAAVATTAFKETRRGKLNVAVPPRSSNQQTPMIPMKAAGGEQRDNLHETSGSAVSSREQSGLGSGDLMSGKVSNDLQITKGLGIDDGAAACATSPGGSEDDKADDGSDTHNDEDKGGATLIEDYMLSSVQGDTIKSANAGGEGNVAAAIAPAISTTEADKGGGEPASVENVHVAKIEKGAPALPRIDKRDFVPKEKSLVGYCEAAARCKIAIEEVDDFCDRLLEMDFKQRDDGMVAKMQDQLQWLTNRYSELTNAMMEWDVDASAALLVEVSRTAAKLSIILAWTAATDGLNRGHEDVRRVGTPSEARRDKATLLMAKKIVLREVIKDLGGWEAVVFLDSGGVNVDVDVSAWPVEDQLAILSTLNDHLRDELEEREKRHIKALTDLLRRLQESERSGREKEWQSANDKKVQSFNQPLLPDTEGGASKEEKMKPQLDLTMELASLKMAKEQQLQELQTPDTLLADRQPVLSKPATAVYHCQQQHEKAVHLVELQPKSKATERSSPSEPLSPYICQDHPKPSPRGPKTPPQQQPRLTPQREVVPRCDRGEQQGKKCLDLIAQADLAERRAQEEKGARLQTGYPLKALAAERQAISDLRIALTKAICAILELCQHVDEVGALSDERSKGEEDGTSVISAVDPSRFPPYGGVTRPPSTLVQMIYSGQDANKRFAGNAYKLSTGLTARTPSGDHHSNAVEHCRSSSSPSLLKPSQKMADTTKGPSGRSFKLKKEATAVAEAGTMARTILRGFLPDNDSDCAQRTGESPSNHPAVPSLPPADLREALSAARAAVTAVPLFHADVCNFDVGARDDGAMDRNGDKMEGDLRTGPDDLGGIGGERGRSSRAIAISSIGDKVAQNVDTSASSKVVYALQADTLWAKAIPSFVRKTLEAQVNRIGQHASLNEREIEILTEALSEVRYKLRTLKEDYVSADAEDVIRTLRKRVRGLNDKVEFLDRQLQLAEESCRIEGGAIEVLENLLRERDVDKELFHALNLKSLDVGLKIRLLETDVGGKTLEVSRLPQHEQRAVVHLKARLMKERGTLNVRKRTVATKLQRSLPHCMRAFERVNRATQRLCSGYSSLPGLLEWGRLTAARLHAVDFNRCSRTNPFSHTGAMAVGSTYDGRYEPLTTLKYLQAGLQTQRELRERKVATRLKLTNGCTGRISTNDGENGNRPLSAAPFPSSSSTSSLPGWGLPLPWWSSSVTKGSNQLPHKNKAVSDVKVGEKGATRRKLATHWNKYGRSNGGVSSAAENDQTVTGLARGFETSTAKTTEQRDTGLSSTSNTNSVAQLLREERAYRQKTSSPHGSDKEQRIQHSPLSYNQFNVPALVPLNNVGMPVRFRQQPRRNQALRASSFPYE